MNNEFKGTPGPWVSEGLHWVGSDGEKVVVSDGPAFGSRSSWPAAEANGYLVKASPELFKAVNDFLNHFEGDIPLWLFEEAEAAVAKALGK